MRSDLEVDVRDGSVDLLARVEKKAGAAASAAPAAEDDLDGTSKRKKGSEKWRPPPQVEPAPAQPVNSSYPRPGRFWKVVGAPKSGLTVWQGVAESSPILPGTLPQGAVVEEVQVVGNRLSFTDFSMRGPPSGWVNIRENGRDMIVVDMEGLSTLNIAEALKESAGMSFQMPQPVQAPLRGGTFVWLGEVVGDVREAFGEAAHGLGRGSGRDRHCQEEGPKASAGLCKKRSHL